MTTAPPSRTLPVVAVGVVTLVVLVLAYVDGTSAYPAFATGVVALLIAARPRFAFSPTTFVFLYYFMWYVIPPGFAERFDGVDLDSVEYQISFLMSFCVLLIGVLSVQLGESFGSRTPVMRTERPLPSHMANRLIGALYASSTLMVVLIVAGSGGLSAWIANPGDAFLNRAGTGVFVILSHFSSLLLACLSGYVAYSRKQRWPLLCFVAWLLVTAPVHGSKAQMTFLLIMLVLPWMRDVRTLSARSILALCCGTGFFVLGLFLRNVEWMDAASLVPYALNYFSTFEYLAISVRDFDPDFLYTFFLPFQKFLTPFGINNGVEYYDMNHLLTDLYFPSAWEIRATEQWPVETDLYLNFFFVGGLPLVAGYLFTIGYLRGVARRNDSLGAWFASAMLTLMIISHLRGSLLNHTDFYMYPYLFVVYIALRRVPLRQASSAPATGRP